MDILLWHEILEPYELAVKELTVKFNHLIKEHHEKGLYSPIESVSGRVKSVSSILEKMQRKEIPPEELEQQVEEQRLANQQLEDAIENSDDPETLERVAREKGYVKEGETLYIDVAG